MTTCIVENVDNATPITHEFLPCETCDNWTPWVWCDIAIENVCGICHSAYTEDYHA